MKKNKLHIIIIATITLFTLGMHGTVFALSEPEGKEFKTPATAPKVQTDSGTTVPTIQTPPNEAPTLSETTNHAPPIIPEGTYFDTGTGDYIDELSTLKLPGVGKGSAQALQSEVLPAVTKTVIALTGGLALLFVIISGILILTAFGNEERLTAAKKTLAWSLIGLLLATLSYAIVQILVSVRSGV